MSDLTPKLVRMAPNGTNRDFFIPDLVSQNVLNSDLKKSRVCPIWGQSDLFRAKSDTLARPPSGQQVVKISRNQSHILLPLLALLGGPSYNSSKLKVRLSFEDDCSLCVKMSGTRHHTHK